MALRQERRLHGEGFGPVLSHHEERLALTARSLTPRDGHLGAIESRRVEGGDRCTLRESADFFSYRRDRVTGRMASFIWME